MYLHCACPSPLCVRLVSVPGLLGCVLLALPAGAACWRCLLGSGQKKSWLTPALFRNVLEGGY